MDSSLGYFGGISDEHEGVYIACLFGNTSQLQMDPIKTDRLLFINNPACFKLNELEGDHIIFIEFQCFKKRFYLLGYSDHIQVAVIKFG